MPTDSHRCPEGGRTCSHCASGASSSADDPATATLRGGALVWASVATFLVPLVLALLGSLAAGRGAGAQLLGALAGLAIGMTASVFLARRIARHRERNA